MAKVIVGNFNHGDGFLSRIVANNLFMSFVLRVKRIDLPEALVW